MKTKLAWLLGLVLLLASPLRAANEIQFDDAALTGQTFYVVLKTGTTALTTGTTFATYTTTRGDFDQAMTEHGVTGLFTYSMPAVIPGNYQWAIYMDADDNGTPSHTDDVPMAQGGDYWDGTKFSGELLASIESQTDDIPALNVDGPVEHAKVPASRILAVKDRNDGTFGVVGNIRMQPGETLWWAIDLKGSQLGAGDLINSVSEPDEDGAQAGNILVDDYGVLATLVKFRLTLDDAATEDDEIEIDITIAPSSGEAFIVTVPVTVLE